MKNWIKPLLLSCALALSQPVLAESRDIVVESSSRADFPVALAALKAQLAADGWNQVAEINLGERLAKKNAVIPGGLVILELTSGGNTIPLLKNEETRYVSALMPCSVSVYGTSDGRVVFSRMNTRPLEGMLDPRLAAAMRKSTEQMDASIRKTLERLGS